MELNVVSLFYLMRYSISHPRDAARSLLQMDIPIAARWTALLITGVLSALVFHFSFMQQPSEIKEIFSPYVISPLATAGVQLGFLLISAIAVFHGGRAKGGTGSFEDGLLLIVWIQAISVAIQVVQLGLMLVLPPAAEMIGLFGVGVYFWLLTHFVAELHGFKSIGLVFVGVLLTMIGVFIALVLVLGMMLAPFVKG